MVGEPLPTLARTRWSIMPCGMRPVILHSRGRSEINISVVRDYQRWQDRRNNHHCIGDREGQNIQFEHGIMYLLPQLFCRADASNLCRMHRHLSSNAPGMRQHCSRHASSIAPGMPQHCSWHASSNASAMPRHAKSKSESQLNKTSSRPTIKFKAQIPDELTSLTPATSLPTEGQKGTGATMTMSCVRCYAIGLPQVTKHKTAEGSPCNSIQIPWNKMQPILRVQPLIVTNRPVTNECPRKMTNPLDS